MENKKYQQYPPDGMFIVQVTPVEKNDSPHEIPCEYTYTVDVRPCACDFVAVFADLVRQKGKCQPSVYAKHLGLSERALKAMIETLTGIGPWEWGDLFACTVSEALLSKTDWEIGKVSRAVGMSAVTKFSRFFRRTHGCSPGEWRERHR